MGVWILGTTAAVIVAILLVTNPHWFGRLRVGDRVRIGGGYEDPPPWLGGRPAVTGRVSAFIDNAAEVELDEPLVVDGASYRVLSLRLRYRRARWTRQGIVHVEVAGAPHAWVESHASYRRIHRGAEAPFIAR